MPLPKIEHPIHEVYLKSLDRKVKFRPFLVKEEKLLLISKESKDVESIKTAIKQILQNCCLEEIDIETLPLFDVEMFFIHLRARSVGEGVKLSFTCNNVVEDQPCGHVTDYMLDLNKVEYEVPEGHDPIVKLGGDIGLKLKYPTLNIVLDTMVDPYTAALKVICDNLDCVFDKESVHYRKDITDEELAAFLEELSVDQIEDIRKFFSSFPRVVLKDKLVCEKCKFEHEVNAGDLYSFFT